MEYYSATERNEIGSFVEMWMDPESIIQNEIRQKEKDKYPILMYVCGIQKSGADEPMCRAGIETQTCGHWGEGEGGTNWESSSDILPLPCVKQMAGGKLLCNAGSSAQCPVMT